MINGSISPLQAARLAYCPPVPPLLRQLRSISCKALPRVTELTAEMQQLFPLLSSTAGFQVVSGPAIEAASCKVGVVLSGGPAAGGHNVIAGLFDALKEMHNGSTLVGFCGGFAGLLTNQTKLLEEAEIAAVRNTGGFDLIGTGRTKIETPEQLEAVLRALETFDALIVIGGDDSNTNGAVLAEYLMARGKKTRVIGVPKTIDADLRSADIELSFGFDTACKTYAELIGNIARDALSAKKYYHFIKLMGRSASHITLECALLTQPNLALIGEEGKGLNEIVEQIVDLIVRRKALGKEYGVILIPEGLVEFIPEIKQLIQELNVSQEIADLTPAAKKIFDSFLPSMQSQLLLSRDSHGNVQVSQIGTELLLIDLVKKRLSQLGFGKFHAQEHFFGYEGRSCFPSNFDATYAYSLGRLAALAVREKLTGVICAMGSLHQSIDCWQPKFVAIADLMHLEVRNNKIKPVIEKALVDINGAPYLYYCLHRKEWEENDHYLFPGPIQFFGEPLLVDAPPLMIRM